MSIGHPIGRHLEGAGRLIVTLVLFSSPLLAQGTTWWVDGSYGGCPGSGTQLDPFCTIQDGIDAAGSGDLVLVRPATYTERIDFGGKAITVRSDVDGDPATHDPDPSVTIIDGALGGSVVTFQTGEGENAVLEGFTITNGKARLGGGIYCNASNPTITGNVIAGNQAYEYWTDNHNSNAYGGGIYCTGASPTIKSNEITGNWTYAYATDPTYGQNRNSYSYGGGIHLDSSSPLIEDNLIQDNYCSGGADGTHYRYGAGIFCLASSAKILRNVIDTNTDAQWGGGIYVGGSGSGLEIRDNAIVGNSANYGSAPRGGGIDCTNASPTITGNTITCNSVTTSGHGGGISCEAASSAAITRNSIYHNSASGNGGGIDFNASSGTVYDNLILSNDAGGTGGGINCADLSSTPALRNNTLWGNTANAPLGGGGVFHADPPPTWRLSNLIARNNWAANLPSQIDPGTVCVVYSNIDGGWSGDCGDGVIDSNPRFHYASTDSNCDTVEDFDFSLRSNSPCIETGDVIDPPSGEQDRGGNPRLLDGDLNKSMRVDMGACEFNNVHVDLAGDFTPCGTIDLDITGTNGLSLFLLIGVPGQFCVEPFGCLFLDFRFPFAIRPMGSIPLHLSGQIPCDAPVPTDIVLQALALDPPTGAGNTSNPAIVTIE